VSTLSCIYCIAQIKTATIPEPRIIRGPGTSSIVTTTDSAMAPQREAHGYSTIVGWHYSATQICDEDTWLRKIESDLKSLQIGDSHDSSIIAVARLRGDQSVYLHSLELKSSYLRELYQSCAGFLPDASISADKISFQEPFLPLCLYMDQMCHANSNSSPNSQEQTELGALVELYNKWIKPSHEAFRERFKEGIVAFQDLGALFTPGEFICSKDSLDEPQLHRVESTEDETTQFRSSRVSIHGAKSPIQEFVFHGWNMQWDNSTRRLKRVPRVFKLAGFQGTRRIISLPYVPMTYQISDSDARQKFLRDLETRGYLWKSLASGPPVCRKHSGLALVLRQGFHGSSPSNRVNVSRDTRGLETVSQLTRFIAE
jgi:hypothetical protein